jgi:hypothetical protein
MRVHSAHAPPSLDRFYFLGTGAACYVALTSLQRGEHGLEALAVLVLTPLGLAAVWRRTRRQDGPRGLVHPSALVAFRVAAWGLATWLAARSGPAGLAGLDAAANLGAGSAGVAGAVALARIPSASGSMPTPRSARSLDAAAFCALAWGIAVALPAGRALWPATDWLLEPLAVDYATSAASIGSTLVLLAAAVRLRVTRRLELGVADRGAGAVALTLAALGVALPATAANVAAPDRVLPLGAIAAALGCAWTACTSEPTRVSSGLRGALAVMLLGAPVALVSSVLARGVNAMRASDRAIVLVTHYQRLLDYIAPDRVHVLAQGRILRSGGPDLARELEARGYTWVEQEAAAAGERA